MSHGRLAIAVIVLAVVGGPLAVAAPASADSGAGSVSDLQSGYWWQAEASGSSVPSPPQVPAGGLWISSNSSGPQAISAIRFSLADGVGAPVVTLRISQAQPSGQVSIVACPATAEWAAPNGAGEWASRPAADCSHGQAVAQIDAGNTTATIDLTSLVSLTGQVNVVLLPSSTSDPTSGSAPVQSPMPVYPTFDASFQPLTASGVTTNGAPASSADLGSPASSGLPGLGSGSVGTGIALPSPVTGLLPPSPALAAPPAPAVVGQTATARPATGLSQVPQVYSPAAVGGKSWRQRVLLALILIDLAAYMMWSRGLPGAGRLARLSIYDLPRAGIGRTERPGSPPPLR